MKMKIALFATIVLATTVAIAQGAPPAAQQPAQQPPRAERQASPAAQMTVPDAQQPQQGGRDRARANEQQSQGEGKGHTPAAPEEKTSVTHHSAKIGGQVINYTATAGT